MYDFTRPAEGLNALHEMAQFFAAPVNLAAQVTHAMFDHPVSRIFNPAAGHIAGATHVPMFQVPNRVGYDETLTSDRPIVVVCKMGGRSAQVTAWLVHNGYQAANLDGGMLAWAAARRPMVSEDGGPPRVA